MWAAFSLLSLRQRVTTALAGLAAAALLVGAAFACGWWMAHSGCAASHAQDTLAATTEAIGKAQATTRTAIARSNAAGVKREQSRADIDAFFDHLSQGATDAAIDPSVDSAACMLPAERLRRWNEANAGHSAAASAPASQPDDGATSAAPSPLGPAEGPGGQPPAGDAGLPPGGESALPADRLPASAA